MKLINESPVLELEQVGRTFRNGSRELVVLHEISFALEAGSSCAVIGPSGSGKTTLLGLCAGLDRPTTGRIRLNGKDLGTLDEEQLAALRCRQVGFIFQSFHLLPTLTALENVMVPLELQGVAERSARERAGELLGRIGLGERLSHYPAQLSGGEQQRIGIARAYIHNPVILFADEPTGNLDSETGHRIESLLFGLNRETGTTLVIVTHNPELADRCDRVLTLRSGRIAGDEAVGAATRPESERQ